MYSFKNLIFNSFVHVSKHFVYIHPNYLLSPPPLLPIIFPTCSLLLSFLKLAYFYSFRKYLSICVLHV